MEQKAFLTQLTQEAKRQSQLGDHHLLPRPWNKISGFFWSHSWQSLAIFSLVGAALFLALNGITP